MLTTQDPRLLSRANGMLSTPKEFEFDPEKSDSNARKHGIDFIEAQALWADADLVEIPTRTTDERRFVVVGKIGARHRAAVITPRDGRTRIIGAASEAGGF